MGLVTLRDGVDFTLFYSLRKPRLSHVWQVWAASALALLAFALRTYGLGSQSLWYDEGFSVWLAGRSLAEITSGDFNPPLYSYALHFWLELVGTTEFSARFLSLLPGVLLVLLTYALGRRLFDALTGIVAALIVSTSPFLLSYSQETRAYTLAGFLTTLSSYLLVRTLLASVNTGSPQSTDGDRSRIRGPAAPHLPIWIGYTLATIAAVYTHYYVFLILPVHGLLVLGWAWRCRRLRPVVLWLAAQGWLILALLPWTPFLLQHYRAQNTTYWPGALSLSFIARRTLFEFVGGSLLDDRITQLVAAGYLALSLIGLLAAFLRAASHRPGFWRKPGLSPRHSDPSSSAPNASFPIASSTLFLLAYLVVPILLTYALTHDRPKFFPRYLLFVAPALFMLTAVGLRAILPSDRTGVRYLYNLYPCRALRPGSTLLSHSGQALVRRLIALAVRRFVRTDRWTKVQRKQLDGHGPQLIVLCSVFALCLCLLLSSSALALRNWFSDPSYGKDDFRAVGRYLETVVAPNEAVILSSGHAFPVFTYYHHREDWYPLPSDPTPAPSATEPLPPAVGAELNQIAAGHRGLWLVLWQNEVVDPNGLLITMLDRLGDRLPVEKAFRGIEVRHYALPAAVHFPEGAEPKHPIQASLAGGLVLLGYEVLNTPVPSGQAADVILFWRATRPSEADYRISLRLRDSNGYQVSQLDQRPAGFMYPTHLWKSGEEVWGRHALPLPPGLLPGSYTLNLVLYPASDIADAQWLELGEITVARPERPPHLDDLDIPYRTTAILGPLELLGHSLPLADVMPGDILDLTLFWRAAVMPSEDYKLMAVVGESQVVPMTLSYPTSHWQAGDVFRTRHRLVLPADLPSGEMPLRIRLDTPEGRAVAPPATLAMLRIGSREHCFDVPADIQHPLRADVGGYVSFLGYDQSAEVLKPGETLHLTLYWQAQQEMGVSYTVFTHLLGSDSLIWGQQDSIPLQGARPTTGWLPGEVLVDIYDITVHSDAPAGDYRIEVGMYDALSKKRLPVFDEGGRPLPDDRILSGQIRVEP